MKRRQSHEMVDVSREGIHTQDWNNLKKIGGMAFMDLVIRYFRVKLCPVL